MSNRLNVSRVIGVVGRPHGIKGYVYVRMVTDYPDTVLNGTVLYMDESIKSAITIEDIKNISIKGGTRTIIKFYGHDSRQAADILRGKELFRAFKDQPVLGEGTNWVDDLIECKVELASSEYIGTIIEVENCAYNDNLIIRDISGKLITIPMYEEYIYNVDVKNKLVILKELPEFI
jgi:16S rRNA processing protein RimM